MNISVFGVGHAGSTIAADLSMKGHCVTLCKTSNKLHNEHYAKISETKQLAIHEGDGVKTANISIANSIEEAVRGKELLIIYIQTNYHQALIREICRYIEDGQTVLIEPGYLSTCYFLKYCNKDITIIEAESSPIDCRVIAPGHVKVLFKNTMNPVGVYPMRKRECAEMVLSQLGYPYEIVSSVVEAALHNPNLIVHTVGAIFSTPRIEYTAAHGGEYSMYREVFTPHVWNLVLALDSEKMDVLERLGCRRLSYVEACKLRNSSDDTRDATEVFFDYANNSSPFGPNVPDSRYVTEDVPEGLVLLESLGNVLSVATPVCTGLINCASALLQRSFREEGRTIERLGQVNLSKLLADS